jgi:hypothetical protein
MKPDYTFEQKKFLEHLSGIGVELETIIFKVEQIPIDVYKLSKEVAIKSMTILNGELNLLSPEENLHGTEINFHDFIGNGFNFETSELKLFTYDENRKVIYHNTETGFAQALLNPPHGLHFTKDSNFASDSYKNIDTIFYTNIIQDYLKIILNVSNVNNINNLRIISWSDNWSNYFDAGKEWWGTFCWTIYDNRNNTIKFLVASSTD